MGASLKAWTPLSIAFPFALSTVVSAIWLGQPGLGNLGSAFWAMQTTMMAVRTMMSQDDHEDDGDDDDDGDYDYAVPWHKDGR